MPYNILLIDEDDGFRGELGEYTDEYSVTSAPSSDDALRILRGPNEIDIVFLNMVTPGARGADTIREIKRLSPELGVVAIAGFTTKELVIEALRAHADDYLEKPLDTERTRETIHRLLVKRSGVDIYSGNIKDKISRVKYFAERNYHRKVCLKDAAETICLSPKYLSRVFREQTGITFSEYRLRIKIDKSRDLVLQKKLNVNQIADKLGYANADSFIRQFKRFVGLTPMEYQKRFSDTLPSI